MITSNVKLESISVTKSHISSIRSYQFLISSFYSFTWNVFKNTADIGLFATT
jgi:hypothetical protein